MEKYFQGQRVNIPKINTNLEVRKALGALSKVLEGRARADEAREEEASSRSRRIAPSGWIPARISVARVPRMQPLQRPMVRPRGALPKREFADSGVPARNLPRKRLRRKRKESCSHCNPDYSRRGEGAKP